MKVACPICRKMTEYEGNPDRPFCSERCKLIDLGEWAMEKRSVPGDHSDSIPENPISPNDDDEAG